MCVAQELPGVVTLECFGELVEELEELGGGLVGQLHRQADDRQIIGLQLELPRRVFLPAARREARCAARSCASLRR